jgi:L-lactate dehydrogenase complex protein LldG
VSFRETILQNVRNNQPSARELPAIPKFHSEQPVDLKREFTAALKELYGEVVTEPPADLKAFLKERFPSAKTICSTVPEYTGNSKPEDFARWSDAGSIDVTIVRSPLGGAETGSVLFSEEQITRLDPVTSFGGTMTEIYFGRRLLRRPWHPGESI